MTTCCSSATNKSLRYCFSIVVNMNLKIHKSHGISTFHTAIYDSTDHPPLFATTHTQRVEDVEDM